MSHPEVGATEVRGQGLPPQETKGGAYPYAQGIVLYASGLGDGQRQRLASCGKSLTSDKRMFIHTQRAVDNTVENVTKAVVRKGLGQGRSKGLNGCLPKRTFLCCFPV